MKTVIAERNGLRVRRAVGEADLARAQALRFDVFAAEMGASGASVDAHARREADGFDAAAEHLLLEDLNDPDRRLAGTCRLMTRAAAERAGGFSSAAEFELSALLADGAPVLELGRTCLHPDYRGGGGLLALWSGLAARVRALGVQTLFGAASFPGTDRARLAAPLALLEADHAAPAALRPRAHGPGAWWPEAEAIDRKAALRAVPPLIKSYLRLGGGVGQGAYTDHDFGTTDVCMVLRIDRIPPGRLALFEGPA